MNAGDGKSHRSEGGAANLPEGCKISEAMVEAALGATGHGITEYNRKWMRRALEAAALLVPAPGTGGAEPVAWGMFSSSAGCLSVTTDEAVAKRWAAETVTGISVAPLCRLSALSSSPVGEMAGWQDMSSAPRGRLIDLWLIGDVRWCDCYYDQICDEWRTSRPSGKLLSVKASAVTHWREPPTPPVAASPQGGR